MKEIEKVYAKLKHKPEDFIVEEAGLNWICKVSQEFIPNKIPNLNNLPNDSREFLWCEMEKKDIDHFQAIKEIARILRKMPYEIGYAGSKDKVAWTVQRISIFKPDLEKIKNFSHKNIILKNFKWEKRKLKMGYLEGNHFKIILRNIEKKDAIKISSKIRSSTWFPNYFGIQRFGSVRNNNVKIGKLILKKDFKKAVMTILTETNKNERPDISYAREKLFREKKFNEALQYFPNSLKQEIQLLAHLSKKPEDYLGAIKSCERKGILMYVHSVQSHLFNEILSRALEEGLDFTKKGHENCLLIGYKSRFYEGPLGQIERSVLEENNLTSEDFDLKEIPYLRIKGSFRKAIVEVKDLKMELMEDENFPGAKKILLEFSLPSGVYATTFLENFFYFE